MTIITALSTWQYCLISGLIFLYLFTIPQRAFANTCSPNGYTVEYVNGVSDTLEEAKTNQQSLKFLLGNQYKNESVDVKLGYNQEHLAGVGDVVEAMSQMLFNPISDYDLHTVLRQIAVDDTTRKLVLVGHSQGALYANSIYNYITSNGEPARSVDVYAVATPASYVAGGGKYVTSVEDAVIYATRLLAQKIGAPAPLAANVSMVGGSTFASLPTTHLFPTYINSAGGRIVADIDSQLDELQSKLSADGAGCFTPPPETTADRLQEAVFSIVDPTADAAQKGVALAYEGSVVAASSAVHIAESNHGILGSMLIDIFSNPNINPAAPENQEKNFAITKKLYGSSLNKDDYDNLNNQGAAAIMAFLPAPTSTSSTPVAATTTTSLIATTTLEVTIATSTTIATTTHIHMLPYTFGSPTYLPEPLATSTATSSEADTPQLPEDTASTIPPEASSTPEAPRVFDSGSSATPFVIAGCEGQIICYTSTTTASISWNEVHNATYYGVSVNRREVATTSMFSVQISLADQATSSVLVVAYDSNNNTVSGSPKLVRVDIMPLQVVPVFASSHFITDTFDTFDSLGWQPFGGNVKNFDFDDGSDGQCFRGGCVVGMGGNQYSTLIPRMYVEQSSALASGAFTIYARAQAGFNNPDPTISLCRSGSNGCLDQTGVNLDGINFFHSISLDGTWHQYYFGWRQGPADVESCVMRDDMNATDCVWTNTGIALGVTFDGVALWSGSGYRSDVGPPYANFWFDELQPQ